MNLRTVFGLTATPLLLLGLIAMATLAPMGSAQAAEPVTYEEILKSVTEATASVTSWSADIKMNMKMGGMVIESSGEILGSGDRIASDLSMQVMGQLMQVKSILGDDGIHWTETNAMGQVQVIKLDMKELEKLTGKSGSGGNSQSTAQNPSKIFENLGKLYDLTFSSTENMDGADVHIVEGTVKEELKDQIDPSGAMSNMGMAPVKIRVAVGAKDGFVRKLEQINSKDEAFMTATYSAIKINPTIEDSVFLYTPPEGATVTDASDMARQGMGGH